MMRWLGQWIRLLPLAMFLIFAAGCDGLGPQSETEQLFSAQMDVDEGNFRSAEIVLKNVLQKNPGNANARLLLGQIYNTTGFGAAAEKEILRAQNLGVAPATLAVALADAYLLQGKFDAVVELPWPDAVEAEEQVRFAARLGDALISKRNLDRAAAVLQRGASLNADSVELQTVQARLLIARQIYQEARDLLDALIRDYPAYGRAWSLSGDLAQMQGDNDRAANDFASAVEKRANKFSDRLKLAKVLLAQGENQRVLDILELLEQRAGNHPEVLLLRGVLQLTAGEDDAAFASFSDALEQNPRDARAHYYLGTVYLKQGNEELAKGHLQQAVTLQPSLGTARRSLGMIYARQGEAESAIEMLAPVVRVAPDDLVLVNHLAAAYLQAGRADSAVNILQPIVVSHPESVMARFRLASALLALGNRDLAIENLNQALEIDPEHPATLAFITATAGSDDDFRQQADSMLHTLVQNHPNSTLLRNTLGALSRISGDVTAAREAYESTLAIDSGNLTARMNLAAMDLAEGKVAQAENQYIEVLAIQPSNETALMKLAEISAARNDETGFRKFLMTAMDSDPGSLAPRLVLARYEFSAKRYERAVEILEPVSGAYPDDPELLLLDGMLDMAMGSAASALPKLERAVALAPQSDQASLMLAFAYAQTGSDARALSSLRRTLELNPANLEANKALARLQLRDEQFEAARKTLRTISNLAPDDPELASMQARLETVSGDSRVALSLRRDAFEGGPSTSRMLALAYQLWTDGARQDSLNLQRDWVGQNPKDVAARIQLAKTYYLLERYAEAEAEYAAVLRLDDDNAIALNDLAMLLMDTDPSRALGLAERAATASPGSASIMDTQSKALLALRQYRKAQRLAERAVSAEPDNKSYQYQLAYASVAAEDYDRADSILNKLLASDDAFPERTEAMALQERLRDRQ